MPQPLLHNLSVRPYSVAPPISPVKKLKADPHLHDLRFSLSPRDTCSQRARIKAFQLPRSFLRSAVSQLSEDWRRKVADVEDIDVESRDQGPCQLRSLYLHSTSRRPAR